MTFITPAPASKLLYPIASHFIHRKSLPISVFKRKNKPLAINTKQIKKTL